VVRALHCGRGDGARPRRLFSCAPGALPMRAGLGNDASPGPVSIERMTAAMKNDFVFRGSSWLTKAIGVMAFGAACVGCGSSASEPASAAESPAVAEPAVAAEATAHAVWRDAIARAPAVEEGCFHASYPAMTWDKIDCSEATIRFHSHPAPSRNTAGVPFTVGNGNDFAAQASGLISQSTGTFPTVTGVTSETDDGAKNSYSIQLNSNFMSGTAACKGVSGCQSWSQFVYSTNERSAFIQDWLIGIGKCPDKTFFADGEGDCYKNSAAVSVPAIAISNLSGFKMAGSAVKNGKDTLVFTAEGEAFSTNQPDTTTNLATAWNASEFNIIGDGGASEAVFNKGASITVKIALADGSTSAPACVANDGTTGETNNLKLGKCTTGGGTSPFIQVTETD
jgi:hypothetical protein